MALTADQQHIFGNNIQIIKDLLRHVITTKEVKREIAECMAKLEALAHCKEDGQDDQD